jgi:CBS domain-containing protein
MKVRDLMSKALVSCRSDTSLAAAGALMWEHDCGILPIVDETGKVTSVITDRDICIALSTRDAQASQIATGDVVKPQAFVCAPDDELQAALKTMAGERVHRLPVVSSEGNLVGLLSLNDIILRAERGDAPKTGISYDEVVGVLQAICAHEPLHAVAA